MKWRCYLLALGGANFQGKSEYTTNEESGRNTKTLIYLSTSQLQLAGRFSVIGEQRASDTYHYSYQLYGRPYGVNLLVVCSRGNQYIKYIQLSSDVQAFKTCMFACCFSS